MKEVQEARPEGEELPLGVDCDQEDSHWVKKVPKLSRVLIFPPLMCN